MSVFSKAAIDAVEATWPVGRVYAPGKVPANPQTPYVVMYSDGGRDATIRSDATAGSDANRLMPMAVGKTADEVDRAITAVKVALRNKRLTVTGYDTTPLALESSGGIVRDPDADEPLSLTLFLTFNAYTTE